MKKSSQSIVSAGYSPGQRTPAEYLSSPSDLFPSAFEACPENLLQEKDELRIESVGHSAKKQPLGLLPPQEEHQKEHEMLWHQQTRPKLCGNSPIMMADVGANKSQILSDTEGKPNRHINKPLSKVKPNCQTHQSSQEPMTNSNTSKRLPFLEKHNSRKRNKKNTPAIIRKSGVHRRKRLKKTINKTDNFNNIHAYKNTRGKRMLLNALNTHESRHGKNRPTSAYKQRKQTQKTIDKVKTSSKTIDKTKTPRESLKTNKHRKRANRYKEPNKTKPTQKTHLQRTLVTKNTREYISTEKEADKGKIKLQKRKGSQSKKRLEDTKKRKQHMEYEVETADNIYYDYDTDCEGDLQSKASHATTQKWPSPHELYEWERREAHMDHIFPPGTPNRHVKYAAYIKAKQRAYIPSYLKSAPGPNRVIPSKWYIHKEDEENDTSNDSPTKNSNAELEEPYKIPTKKIENSCLKY